MSLSVVLLGEILRVASAPLSRRAHPVPGAKSKEPSLLWFNKLAVFDQDQAFTIFLTTDLELIDKPPVVIFNGLYLHGPVLDFAADHKK